jgi:hypothetical protein
MRLSAFFFVGITEHFADDVASLANAMGWPKPRIPRRTPENTSTEPAYRRFKQALLKDAALVDKLRELNRADIELYEEGQALRGR